MALLGACLLPQEASAAGPRLGKSITAVPAGGRVFVQTPGGRSVRLRTTRLVPTGSIFDTRHGAVRILSATNGHGATQSAQFSGGQFRALQPPGEGGTLQVDLVGGNFAACHRAGTAAASNHRSVRHLDTKGGYNTGVRTNGRYGSGGTHHGGFHGAIVARAQTVQWDTVDRCDGTAIVDQFGEVDTVGHTVPARFALQPQERIAYRCGTLPTISKAYCAVVLGKFVTRQSGGTPVTTPAEQLTLVTNTPFDNYALSIDAPDNFTASNSYPLSGPSHGFRRSDVSCVPVQGRGVYQFTWRINGAILATIDYQAAASAASNAPCISNPFGRGTPADLTQSLTTTQGHVVVHYTTDPADAVNVSSRAAAETVAQTAESALAYYTTTLGMPMYANDGDGKLDIYIERQTSAATNTFLAPTASHLSALPRYGQPVAAFMVVPPAQVSKSYDIAFSLFGALRDAIGRLGGIEPGAFTSSTDAWAANNFLQQAHYVPALSQPLDCDLNCPETAPWSQWRFYQHLAERFGFSIVAAIFNQDAADVRAQAASHMDQALAQVLAVRGTSLSTELAQYAMEDLSASWQAPWINAASLAQLADGKTVTVNPAGGSLPELPPIVANHLSAPYLKLSIARLSPCITDTLTVQTEVPAGGIAPGASVQTGGAYSAVASTSSGATASVSVTFNSCNGAVVRIPFVNGTPDTPSMMFSSSGTLVRASG